FSAQPMPRVEVVRRTLADMNVAGVREEEEKTEARRLGNGIHVSAGRVSSAGVERRTGHVRPRGAARRGELAEISLPDASLAGQPVACGVSARAIRHVTVVIDGPKASTLCRQINPRWVAGLDRQDLWTVAPKGPRTPGEATNGRRTAAAALEC